MAGDDETRFGDVLAAGRRAFAAVRRFAVDWVERRSRVGQILVSVVVAATLPAVGRFIDRATLSLAATLATVTVRETLLALVAVSVVRAGFDYRKIDYIQTIQANVTETRETDGGAVVETVPKTGTGAVLGAILGYVLALGLSPSAGVLVVTAGTILGDELEERARAR